MKKRKKRRRIKKREMNLLKSIKQLMTEWFSEWFTKKWIHFSWMLNATLTKTWNVFYKCVLVKSGFMHVPDLFISTNVSSTRRGEVTQHWILEAFPVVSPTNPWALAHRVRKRCRMRTTIIWKLLNSICLQIMDLL